MLAIKKIITLAIITALISACLASELPIVSEQISDAPQTSRSSEIFVSDEYPLDFVNQEDIETETTELYQFIVPKTEHQLKEEMLSLLTEFSAYFPFPEFENTQTINHKMATISTNLAYKLLYRETIRDFPGLAGVSGEDNEYLNEKYENPIRSAVVLREDLTTLGRWFFGEEFYFPPGLICDELAPLDPSSDYYYLTYGRGGFFHKVGYMMLDVWDDTDSFTAIFLPYDVYYDYESGGEAPIARIDFDNLYHQNNAAYHANYEEWHEKPVYSAEEYLELAKIQTPQEEFPTITVTFRAEKDGRLVAVSSVYNGIQDKATDATCWHNTEANL